MYGNCKRLRILAGLLTASFLALPQARAVDGRITFNGAITAPTCVAGPQNVRQAKQTPQGQAVQGNCPVAGTLTRSNGARSYALRVTQLASVTIDPRVNTYFRGFVPATDAQVAVQTYR